jgi:hypothetical protein
MRGEGRGVEMSHEATTAMREQIMRLMQEESAVRVKRSSGAWQEDGRVERIIKGDAVYVSWPDEENEGVRKGKVVAIDDLLSWQKSDDDDTQPMIRPEAIARREGKMKHQETKEGYPKLSFAEYRRMYETDIREFGAKSAATFDFQGYVSLPKEYGGPKDVFRDVLATNGILKDDEQPGIHIGTDGVKSDRIDGKDMNGPGEVREYIVYITIPGSLQKRLGIVCRNDSCHSIEQFRKKMALRRRKQRDD